MGMENEEFRKSEWQAWPHEEHYDRRLINEHALKDPALLPNYEDLTSSLEQAGLDPSEPVSYDVRPDERVLLRAQASFDQYRNNARADGSGDAGNDAEASATEARERADREARKKKEQEQAPAGPARQSPGGQGLRVQENGRVAMLEHACRLGL